MRKLILIGLIFFAGGNLNYVSLGKVSVPDYPEDFVWIDYKPTTHKKTLAFSYVQTGVFESLTIPLKRAGNLILLEATIDGISGNLILDTGAAGMVLNSIYFRQGRKAGNLVAGGITGSTGTVSRTKIRNIQISEMFFDEMTADVMDLGHIENARNIKVLGFFGLSLIANKEVVIDLKNSIMELHRLDNSGNRLVKPKQNPAMDLNIPVSTSSGVMFFDAYISERKLSFCLDTGAESNVLSSQLPNRVLSTVDIFRRSTLRGAGSQSVEVLYGVMNNFTINNKSIPGMKTIITNLSAMGEAYAVRVDGMLGCDFLEKGIFYINLKQNLLGICFYREDLK